ncbi:MAG: type II toxin-antitoxin system RelE/ParE family toxin [Candidatus Marinimicrobia bacterium]|nr:type II toxin-antitoxin system RelE/ParE family toxin [Candidatus Neomarinimicrobiota bacterium]MBL7010021.1 type II toxin-antitoxin system RelE/ParE family toxin [Candidatus Neomarinimicrobiota bacterium]MBL7029731.1 type II toxin-antitoxin system RelE/ParE family toxin [Candidatus Neomarinimicrobiota bacterium]
MNLIFVHPADKEFIDTYHYYEDQLIGLGDQFLNEFNKSIKIIINHPTIWNKVGKRTRRSLIKRFPFLILYVFEKDTIHITCIAHQHRNPDYYIDRMI